MKTWIFAALGIAVLGLMAGLSTLLPLPLSVAPGVALGGGCLLLTPIGMLWWLRPEKSKRVRLRSSIRRK